VTGKFKSMRALGRVKSLVCIATMWHVNSVMLYNVLNIDSAEMLVIHLFLLNICFTWSSIYFYGIF
jgi:hypothetical protein